MKLARLLSVVLIFGLVVGTTARSYAQDDAAALYKSKCLVCHGADGEADTPVGQKTATKDFHAPEIAKMSDAEFTDAINKGKGKMQGYQGKLTDDQIKALVKYVRSLK